LPDYFADVDSVSLRKAWLGKLSFWQWQHQNVSFAYYVFIIETGVW